MKLCQIVGWFKGQRILETADGVFIPQFKRGLFSSWRGVDKDCDGTWGPFQYHLEHCGRPDIESANAAIKSYMKYRSDLIAEEKRAKKQTIHCVD